jgi:hypothetical protein
VSVPETPTDAMCGYASRRSTVKLRDGRTAMLVRWPGDHNRARRQGKGRARIEFSGGRTLTVQATDITEVFDDA